MNELPAHMLMNLKKVSTKRVMVSCCFFLSFKCEGCFFFSIVGCCFNENKYERKFKEYEICWLLSHHYICLCHAYAIECIGSMFVESTQRAVLHFLVRLNNLGAYTGVKYTKLRGPFADEL